MKLLSISTDRKIFEKDSPVQKRMIETAKQYGQVHIIVFAGKEYREIPLSPNCWAYPTRSITKWTYPFDAMSLGRFIAKRLGITHITCQDPFLTAMAGLYLKHKTGADLEMQLHTDIGSPNFTYTFGNRIRKAMALSYLRKADRVRVVSERIKKYLTSTLGIDPQKIEVRPIKVDVEWIMSAPVIPSADLRKKYPQFNKIALMASRLEREKNIELAIRAWPKVLESVPNVGLIIVGSGSLEGELKSLARKFGLEKNVIFEKWADQATIASYYKSADAFLNTSLYEGYGMTLVEARAAGCKVISTDVGVADEIGAEIMSYQPDEAAHAIIQGLRN